MMKRILPHYPLGLLGAPKENSYDGITHRLRELSRGSTTSGSLAAIALYIGPLFESVGHGLKRRITQA